MKRLLHIALALVILAGAASTLLFLIQGGFGGGHGRFDRTIVVLGLPWILISWPEFLYRHDSIWLLVLPFVINLSIVGGLLALRLHARPAE